MNFGIYRTSVALSIANAITLNIGCNRKAYVRFFALKQHTLFHEYDEPALKRLCNKFLDFRFLHYVDDTNFHYLSKILNGLLAWKRMITEIESSGLKKAVRAFVVNEVRELNDSTVTGCYVRYFNTFETRMRSFNLTLRHLNRHHENLVTYSRGELSEHFFGEFEFQFRNALAAYQAAVFVACTSAEPNFNHLDRLWDRCLRVIERSNQFKQARFFELRGYLPQHDTRYEGLRSTLKGNEACYCALSASDFRVFIRVFIKALAVLKFAADLPKKYLEKKGKALTGSRQDQLTTMFTLMMNVFNEALNSGKLSDTTVTSMNTQLIRFKTSQKKAHDEAGCYFGLRVWLQRKSAILEALADVNDTHGYSPTLSKSGP